MTDHPVSQQRKEHSDERDDQRRITNALKRRLTNTPLLARAAAVGLSSLSIAFVVLFMFVLETRGELTLFTRPLTMQLALTLPYLIGILTIGTTAGALLAWRYRYWSLTARIHQTILALLGLAFTWQLSLLGFLPL